MLLLIAEGTRNRLTCVLLALPVSERLFLLPLLILGNRSFSGLLGRARCCYSIYEGQNPAGLASATWPWVTGQFFR